MPKQHKHRSRSRSSSASPVRKSSKKRHKDRSRSRSPRRHKSRQYREESSESRSPSPSDRGGGTSRDVDKEERRRQKAILKALESPEEKRARRLAKKEEKLRHQRQKEGWDKEYLGYTNADNPFGDHQLLEKFVWGKKRKQDVSELKLSKAEVERRERQRQEETRRELEKVKKRRQEREREREAREEEMQLLQRMKEADMFKEWEAQEDNFHLDQAKLRSRIRIETGKAKPIDILAKYISSTTDEEEDIEVQEPYHLLKGLNIVDLEDLLEDIKVYSEIEVEAANINFWRDIALVCEDEVAQLKKVEESMSGDIGARGGAGRRAVINPSVLNEVNAVFKGKTHDQLVLLEDQINKKIHSSAPGTDVGYWEALLTQLKAHMARARLKDRHQFLLRSRLQSLRKQAEEGGEEAAPLFPSATSGTTSTEGQSETASKSTGESSEQPASTEDDNLIDEQELLELAYSAYEAGNYSPTLLKSADLEEGDEIVTPEDDYRARSNELQRVVSGEVGVSEYKELKMTRTIGSDGQAEEEYDFNTEVILQQKAPIWKEKYRPRKPRFFNRVHTGFEWNKYNQTHYDTDNPPPKIVQGYKFNIFYPDLIDKMKTPQYTLTPDPANKDFATLRFKAGPPYEDIAFKIVNREWECSWKHGFRSQFNNNILQLWFRFKRNRYRR